MELVEIHEQRWFPDFLRDQVTDALEFILSAGGIYEHSALRLASIFRVCRTTRVLDLCSGSSGPWLWMCRAFEENDQSPPHVFLSDKYPNKGASQKIAAESNISYITQPIDALNIPASLPGFRTMFSSFHHFGREQAISILQNTVDTGEGIAIFEVARPRLSTMVLTSLMLIGGFLSALFMRPFRLSRFFWTCVVPIVPLVLFLDGLVSCLRAYSLAQLSEIISSLHDHGYAWELGEDPEGPAAVTYLIGYPLQVDKTGEKAVRVNAAA